MNEMNLINKYAHMHPTPRPRENSARCYFDYLSNTTFSHTRKMFLSTSAMYPNSFDGMKKKTITYYGNRSNVERKSEEYSVTL